MEQQWDFFTKSEMPLSVFYPLHHVIAGYDSTGEAETAEAAAHRYGVATGNESAPVLAMLPARRHRADCPESEGSFYSAADRRSISSLMCAASSGLITCSLNPAFITRTWSLGCP